MKADSPSTRSVIPLKKAYFYLLKVTTVGYIPIVYPFMVLFIPISFLCSFQGPLTLKSARGTPLKKAYYYMLRLPVLATSP